MGNTLIFLRHAETRKDKNNPASKWVLTEEGIKSAKDLAETGIFDDVDIIISSGEEKAYQTAKPFSDRLKKEITRIPELNELDRDKLKLVSRAEYEKMMSRFFDNLDYSIYGLETANRALSRFKKAVDVITRQNENKKILIVTHGTVLTLYFASLQNKLGDAFQRWKRLEFCGWGVVENNKVFKDIV